jgi:hypothetical protein
MTHPVPASRNHPLFRKGRDGQRAIKRHIATKNIVFAGWVGWIGLFAYEQNYRIRSKSRAIRNEAFDVLESRLARCSKRGLRTAPY